MLARSLVLAILVSSMTSLGLDDSRALTAQVDRQLRTCRTSHLLKPKLEVLPSALRLEVVVMRSSDRAVLGSISTKAKGSNRNAQLRALVAHVCREAGLLT